MPSKHGETWQFQVHEPKADRVFLVRYSREGTSAWSPMKHVQPGVWELRVRLQPGRYRFGYFTCEGEAYFNGGSFGLSAQRLSEADGRVEVAPLPEPMVPCEQRIAVIHDDLDDVAAGARAV